MRDVITVPDTGRILSSSLGKLVSNLDMDDYSHAMVLLGYDNVSIALTGFS